MKRKTIIIEWKYIIIFLNLNFTRISCNSEINSKEVIKVILLWNLIISVEYIALEIFIVSFHVVNV